MNSKKQKKTIVGLIVSIIALLMFTIGMTFAYFTASSSATSSSMSFGTLAVSFYNDEIGVSIESDAQHNKVIPGCTLDVTGKIVTTSTISSLLRIKPSVEVTPAQGSELVKATAENTLLGILINSFETDDGNWLRANGTGSYLYYAGKVVPNGQVTFSNVVMELPANEFGNDWQGATFTVTIEVEAIQAEHVQYNNSGTLTDVNFTYNQQTNTKQDIVNQIAGIVTTTDANADTIWGVEFPTVEAEILPAPTQAQLNGLKYLDFELGYTDGAYYFSPAGYAFDDYGNERISSNISNGSKGYMGDNRYVSPVFKKVEVDSTYHNMEIDNADKTNGKFAIEIPKYVKVVNNGGVDEIQFSSSEEYDNDTDYSVFMVYGIFPSAFYNVAGLNSITIPETVSHIVGAAIYGCGDLEEVYYNATNVVYENWQECEPIIYECGSENDVDSIAVYVGSNVQALPKCWFDNSYDGHYDICNIFINSASTAYAVDESDDTPAESFGETLSGFTYIYFANGITTGTGQNSIYTYVTGNGSGFVDASEEAPEVNGYTAVYKRAD